MPEDAPESNPPHAAPQPDPADGQPKRSTVVRVVIWVVILGAFGILAWVIMHHKPVAATARPGRRGFSGPVTLTVKTAHKGDLGVYLQAIGTVTPVHTVTITSQATGLITQVDYREGQMVRRGQQLVQIDPRPYQAQVLAAQGALERDSGLLAQARMDLARYQAAWARNAIAKQTLDDQEKLVMQQEGTVKSDQGSLKLDQVNLSYCDIIAPISGRVGLRLVDPGNVVQAGGATPLVVITQLQPITVVFTIPEDDVQELQEQLHQGQPLQVDVFDRAEVAKLATGKLLTTDNLIDTTTGTLKLRAIFSNGNGALFPNLFVNTRLLLKTLRDVIIIPSSTIQQNGDTSFVFLIQNGVAHIRDVKPGVTDEGMTEVDGLQAGDVVADSSFEKLQDGSKVVISKQEILPSSVNEKPAP